MDLLFDIKHLIASINPEAWYWMYRVDDEFKNYASSIQGINEYKKIHTLIKIGEYYTTYKLFNNLHREDGPAIIYKNGEKQWWVYGKIHRVDGPAITYSDGQEWYFNGKLHREDGPAYISNDIQSWYINGERHQAVVQHDL